MHLLPQLQIQTYRCDFVFFNMHYPQIHYFSQLPGERSIMKRTYVEDVFDNLKNESGIVGFYLILAWQTNLQTRSNADFNLNDLEQHIGKL